NKKSYYSEYYDEIVDRWKNSRYDVVLLAYHEMGILGNSSRRTELLKLLKRNSNKLIWLDTKDSTGSCEFEVLEYVDRYLKKQILRDLDLYKKNYYGDRVFTDFYRRQNGVTDELFDSMKPMAALENKYIEKIGVSWNIGLNEQYGMTGDDKEKYTDKFKEWNFHDEYHEKKYDLHYKVTIHDAAISFQRKKIRDFLLEMQNVNMPDMDKKVPYDEYIDEFMDSKAVISPFGWGEICFRDFDAFSYGIALVKPDMSHLVTYPDWYIDGETCIEFAWDFSDFKEKINYICQKENTNRIMKIAKNGQNLFKKMHGEYGKKAFVRHLIEEIKI
ncbi:MAG: hypothetical protein K5894_12930, partial [Lachnospiraceae bacterium]|nr:hypothetical protein [Lachnospiraceae bacterium]